MALHRFSGEPKLRLPGRWGTAQAGRMGQAPGGPHRPDSAPLGYQGTRLLRTCKD